LIGRTRTADAGNNDSLRFAVVSCSNYQAGYFNAYKDISVRNDIAAVLHLGDYIYEYQSGGYGYTGDTMRTTRAGK
jgi:alkaline phosphatase D